MAGNPSRGYFPDRTANIGGVKDVFVEWTGGTSPVVQNYSEVVSVAYSGTGVFLVTLSQSYNGIRNVTTSVKQASFAAAGCHYLVPTAESSTNGTVTLQACKGSDGTAVAPASGDVIRVTIQVGVIPGTP
jgi:hypothetical protein